MTSPADVVRNFFERMQTRDWAGAEQCLSPEIHITYTATGEQFHGPAFLAMNRAYPEGWTIKVVETVAADDRVAAQVIVDHGDDRFWCAGFHQVVDGLITSGTEHWVTAGADEAPDWRATYRS